MSRLLLLVLFVVVNFSCFATTKMVVIDSGTDIEHEAISPYVWTNIGEIPGNNRDEDRNGYQDDIYGWNFAEDNNQVIDYSYLGILNDDIRRFFSIQSRSFDGTVTEEDKSWMDSKRSDKEFIKSLTIYGNFMHGTHVAGIMVADAPLDIEIMSVKLIPTEVKLPTSFAPLAIDSLGKRGYGYRLVEKALGALAVQQMVMMGNIAAYIDGHGVNIANGSFGTGYNQAAQIAYSLYKTIVFRAPTADELDALARHFLNTMIKEGRDQFVLAAKNTLFVFAAGNDGANNDKFPSSPTNIDADNVLSVAATYGRDRLASFSNYGVETVDVAAPGVSISSSVPGNNYLRVSGTSQASPYVANVAARVLDTNDKLTPLEIKKIIMGTVDKKSFLTGIVKSGGVVNLGRAIQAGSFSLTNTLDQSIAKAVESINDVIAFRSAMNIPTVGDKEYVLPLPSPFAAKL